MPKLVTDPLNTAPVFVRTKKDNLTVTIPTSLNKDWGVHTRYNIKKTTDTMIITRCNNGEYELTNSRYSIITLPPLLAAGLDWDSETLLLMTVSEDKITLKAPEGIDFCLGSLYESFLLVRLSEGVPNGEAITILGEQSGVTFNQSTLKRWREGSTPPAAAINIMIEAVTKAAITWAFEPSDMDTYLRGIRLAGTTQE